MILGCQLKTPVLCLEGVEGGNMCPTFQCKENGPLLLGATFTYMSHKERRPRQGEEEVSPSAAHAPLDQVLEGPSAGTSGLIQKNDQISFYKSDRQGCF